MIIFNALKQHTLQAICCLLLGLFATQSIAAQLYRYKNEQGNLVMGHAIPPKYVSKGYDILNAQGRIIERVPPALNTEQISLRDAKLEKEKQKKIAQAAQNEIDATLKQLYSHPDDAVRILKRRIQDINSVIQVKKVNIENSEKQILALEEQAANKQRKGFNIPKSILNKIDLLKKVIINAQADIQELKKDYKIVLKEFDTKIRRLELIKHQKSSQYSELLKSLENDSKTDNSAQ